MCCADILVESIVDAESEDEVARIEDSEDSDEDTDASIGNEKKQDESVNLRGGF